MGYYDQAFLTTTTTWHLSSHCPIAGFRPYQPRALEIALPHLPVVLHRDWSKIPVVTTTFPARYPNIFQELDTAKVSWKIYYTVTQGFCLDEDDCLTSASAAYPATDFSNSLTRINICMRIHLALLVLLPHSRPAQ